MADRGRTVVAGANEALAGAKAANPAFAGRTVVVGAYFNGQYGASRSSFRRFITAALVEDVYGLACEVIPDPQTGTPPVVPAARASRRPGSARTPG